MELPGNKADLELFEGVLKSGSKLFRERGNKGSETLFYEGETMRGENIEGIKTVVSMAHQLCAQTATP